MSEPSKEAMTESRKFLGPYELDCSVVDLARLLDSFAAKERLACINAMCVRCKNGEIPQRVEKHGYIENFDVVKRGDWFHGPTSEYDHSYCEAEKIHEVAALEKAGEVK